MPPTSLGGRPLFLVGFMGTGKSTVGALLAARLDRRFVDLDVEVEDSAHASIAQIFASERESGFRLRESEALRRVSAERAVVIATGGGTPTVPANLELMLSMGVVVCLTASPAAIVARIGDARTRPLLAGQPDVEAEIRRLLETRQDSYGRAHLRVDTTDATPEELTEAILHAVTR